MDKNKILSMVDHTLLDRAATWEQIKTVCDDAVRYGTASVCIPPCYVKDAAEYLGGRAAVCTVIGFPNGYNTTEIKCAEAEQAVSDGADEIDMVINIGYLKDGRYDELLREINLVKAAGGGKLLKVIIETCALTDSEKIKMCGIVSSSNADFIKTSTGFAGGGATFDDIKLFADNVSRGLKIKAAGGIRSFEDAERFIALGADRLGTSALVKLMKE
ncbi:MAG: deoxyribose-phosphate aldolase [Clostridia bacterium]|nr:deoxyribose-phosphate aldolase [Clostridia bacterium]